MFKYFEDQYHEFDNAGSDKDKMHHITHALAVEIITKEQMEADDKTYKTEKRGGAYLNYLNQTVLDLSRYQIGHTTSEHLKLSEK